MLICLVGKSGSGKSYIGQLLSSYSEKIVYLDIDKIAHKVLDIDEVKRKLILYFGDIITDGKVDRKKLGNIVFNNKKSMEMLTEITWNGMEELIDEFLNQNKNKIVILDYQFLPKTKYFSKSDINILVDAPLEIRLKRATERDNITKEKFLERENASLDFSLYSFNYKIENVEKEKTKRKIGEIYGKSIIHR